MNSLWQKFKPEHCRGYSQLWQQTKAYIYKVAKRYSGYAEMDDLMQEGYLGLNAAVEHYKPDQGPSSSAI